MLLYLIYLFLALFPIALFFSVVYVSDIHEPEPLKYLIITFLLGVLITPAVLYIGDILKAYTGASVDSPPLLLFVYAMGIVACTEEGLKFLMLRLYSYPHDEFDEPYDGIMYAVSISLGFAAVENILYTFNQGVHTAVWRMITAIPLHVICGVIMGYYAGKAKFTVSRMKATLLLAQGLVFAILFHGFYDYFLFIEQWISLSILSIIMIIWGIQFINYAMEAHVAISPHATDNEDLPPVE